MTPEVVAIFTAKSLATRSIASSFILPRDETVSQCHSEEWSDEESAFGS
jgi:hypothetical protein